MSCSKTTVDPKQVHLSSALTVLLGDHSSATWASPTRKRCQASSLGKNVGTVAISILHLGVGFVSNWTATPFCDQSKRLENLTFHRWTSRCTPFSDKPLYLASMDWLMLYDSMENAEENHVSLWIFSFKAKGSGGYPAQQRSNWVVDLFLPFTKNLNTIGEKHPMFQGGKPRQTSETIRYLAPKTIGKVFDVFESSVGLADEAFVGARPICLGWMWYPALAATWFSGTVYIYIYCNLSYTPHWPTDTGTEIYTVGKALWLATSCNKTRHHPPSQTVLHPRIHQDRSSWSCRCALWPTWPNLTQI